MRYIVIPAKPPLPFSTSRGNTISKDKIAQQSSLALPWKHIRWPHQCTAPWQARLQVTGGRGKADVHA